MNNMNRENNDINWRAVLNNVDSTGIDRGGVGLIILGLALRGIINDINESIINLVMKLPDSQAEELYNELNASIGRMITAYEKIMNDEDKSLEERSDAGRIKENLSKFLKDLQRAYEDRNNLVRL